MRSARLLALALLAAAPLLARAADAPHEDGLFCSNCHMGHLAPGGSLTKLGGNFTLCDSCHTNSSNFGFDNWTSSAQAVPGVSGRHHRWDANASNLGATPPSTGSTSTDEQEMAKRLDAGRLMCSTCHDQHDADYHPVSGRGRQTVSAVERLDAVPPLVPGNGLVSVITPVTQGATAKRYLISIVTTGTQSSALFKLSNDSGKSWFGCPTPTNYTNYQPYVASPSNACQAGPDVRLNDGTNVRVAFGAGTFGEGDGFRFWVSYPFLRADATDSKMCVTCHRDRNMRTVNVEGTGTHPGTNQPIVPGDTVFHHPVDEVQATTPLDANGAPQSGSGDGEPSNNLVVVQGGKVGCLSCHRVHNADSNSLTPDP
ncbi:MAG TPA: hypothetical protein VFL83_22065 [Anaeromyxobacter sp.]|nr:hypothetical protein [Anaeromyxobacter sp.]